MRKTLFVLAIICVLFATATADRPLASSAQSLNQRSAVPALPPQAARIPAAAKPAAIKDFGKVPIYFTPNAGQMAGPVEFYVAGKDKTVYFTPEGVTYALSYGKKGLEKNIGGPAKMDPRRFGPAEKAEKKDDVAGESKRWAVKMDFVGANPDVKLQGMERTGAAISYFKGKPGEWKAGLPAYSRIIYKDLWPGIDLVYQGQKDKLKYEFIVHPGADPAAIDLAWRGAEKIRMDDSGRLEIETPAGSFVDETPSAYQEVGSRKTDIAMEYDLRESPAPAEKPAAQIATPAYSCGFKVGAYDKTRDLVLDPATIVYCGYIGGADNDFGFGIAVDGSGNAYVTGYTISNQSSFPVKVGPYLTYNGGDADVFVAKVNASGTALVYCGYIGGSGFDEAYGIAVDGSGNAYVTGYTYSDENTFPVTVGPDLSYNGNGNDSDAFVAKVNASGTALVYCGYIGGAWDDDGIGIAVDGSGNAYVTGDTASDEDSFPRTVGPGTTYSGGSYDAFVAKVNASGSALVYCGYIGGAGDDYGSGIAVDGSGNAYVTGYTDSDQTTFPVLVGPSLTYSGRGSWDEGDAFVAKVNASGSALVYCGYIGGSDDDQGFGIAVDGSGNAYVTGTTLSDQTTFPVSVGPDLSYNGDGTDWDAFVAKVNASGTALVYCGYIGSIDEDIGTGIAVDGSGNAYVTGATGAVTGISVFVASPIAGSPKIIKHNGRRGTKVIAAVFGGGGGFSAFLAKVNASGTALGYVTYIAGSGFDFGFGVAVDGSGNVYVTGFTSSDQTAFPVTVGPDLSYNGGDSDAFVAKIISNANADIAVTKTTDNLTPKFGETFNYTVTATNNGPQGATGLKITDSLPAALAYVSSTASKGTYTSATGIWDIGALANGGTATLTLGVRGTSSGFVTNTASVSALNETDPVPGNNAASASVTVKNTYRLTIAAGTGGTTNPVPGTYTYDEGTTVSISATAATGYRFGSWTGDASGTTGSVSITMNGDKTVTANFIRLFTLTIIAGTGGTTNPVPGIYTYDEGTSVSIQATAATGYRFLGWSGDASGTTSPISVTMNGNKTVTANFIRRYTLTITAGAGGTTSPVPGIYTYDEGTSVSVQAVPAAAYQLDSWTGDASGSANTVTIVMNGNKAVQANFTRVVKAPLVLTGVKLINRNVSMIEYVARLRWQPNPANTGTITYRIYQIENGQASVIANVGAGTYEYIVRGLLATKAYLFGVTAVNSQGWESDMVQIAVQ